MGNFLAGLLTAPTPRLRAIAGGVAGILLTTGIGLLVGSLSPMTTPLGTGVLEMGVASLCPVRVEKSLEVLREEQKRTRKERKVFKRFASRVDQLTPDTPRPDSPTAVPAGIQYSGNHQHASTGLESVRDRYAKTVMDLDHYGEDYGDSLEESLAAEFGDDIATALLHGDALTPSLQTTLVNAAREAANERAAYQQTLTRERETLSESYHALQELTHRIETVRDDVSDPASFDALIETHEHLARLEAQTDEILQERQERIADHPQQSGIALYEYLHANQDWTYPVLADTLDLQPDIEALHHDLTVQLARFE